ncbi:tenascin-N-like [Brachionichthys hirsutus]|uniref:tenascin-N-like n=1 Tax=Brachionichthys hirsutus TaxID=412623 RepID=UPI00360504B8
MSTGILWVALPLLALLCTISPFSAAEIHPSPSAPEQGVTFSHVYKIDIPGSSRCHLEPSQTQDDTGTITNGENDIIFRHNIRLQKPTCECEESESFKSLLYRVNGLEEEVNYLKTQCTRGCCGGGVAAGMDTSCSGHGNYQHDTCSCLCNPGWEGPDCSESTCPAECSDNGRCMDGKCVCKQGYEGDSCRKPMCPDNCNDKGHCVGGRCECFSHVTGDDCSIQRCPSDCTGNGQCVDGQCICDQGLYGEDCSLVFGPQGLRLTHFTDVSLLVEWDPVRGAEYYILSYHPKDEESVLQQVQVPSPENSYLLSGLSPGVTYIIRVYAVIREIQSEAAKIAAATELDAPANLSAQDATESSFTLSWHPVRAEINGYTLSYSSSEGSSGEIPVGPDRTSFTLTSLRPGLLYTVYIWANKGNNVSKKIWTNAETEPDTPANLLARDETESSFSLSWDPVQADIDGYVLAYNSSVSADVEIPVGSDSTSYRLTGLSPGVLYTVSIWAVKGDKSTRKTSTKAETGIDGPADLQATDVRLDAAVLTWTPPLADIEGYILTYSDEDGDAETVERQLGAGERTFSVSGLNTGKRYVITIMAYRGHKRSKAIKAIFKTVGFLYPFPSDCLQIMKNGNKKSGVYTIYLNNDLSGPAEVYCDMDTDGGGWLVLQRRTVGKLDFLKRWRQYIAGFGNMTEEFWLGLDKMYELTNTPTRYELRVDLGLGSERVYAVYDDFKIAPVKQKFKLTIGKYSGTAGDAMTYHQGRSWTTIDSDNDIALSNCALTHRGAWWYKNCHLANLNGNWGDSRHSMGVNWKPWKGHLTSLDFTEMKIRPVGALSSRTQT